MTIQNYLMVNQSTSVVDNVCIWDGNPQTWTPPAEYLMLIDATTPALIWFFDPPINDYVLREELGAAGIGFTWNGTECVTNEPKPTPPATSGL